MALKHDKSVEKCAVRIAFPENFPEYGVHRKSVQEEETGRYIGSRPLLLKASAPLARLHSFESRLAIGRRLSRDLALLLPPPCQPVGMPQCCQYVRERQVCQRSVRASTFKVSFSHADKLSKTAPKLLENQLKNNKKQSNKTRQQQHTNKLAKKSLYFNRCFVHFSAREGK